ncbi:glycosyltransferase family 4 protein [Georgenia phoenicis]|uniref:glycosyltransferase family 4 protein n=1 Tax=unclassified Georgenia TaxID=2626815 RepID=UPI0039AFD887
MTRRPERPLRITYIHQHFHLPSEAGGSRPWEFARRLAARGHTVTIIAGGNVSSDSTHEGVRVLRARSRFSTEMTRRRRLAAFVLFMLKSSVTASRLRADVVLASSTPLTTAVPGIIAAWARRCAFVFEVRDLWPEAPIALGELRSRPMIWLARTLERLAYKRAGHVIALSPGMAEGVHDVAPSAPVTVVPNASDIALFTMDEQRRQSVRAENGWAGKTVILYAGSMGRTYDLPWIVDVAAHLPAGHTQFVVCGAGAQLDRLREQATSAGLDADSLLVGAKAKSEIADLLPAADFAVSTLLDNDVLHVNSLNKVFDALAAGRPVLFNHGGWLSDLVCEAGAGWRLSRDPRAAADQLVELLSRDPDVVVRASAASRGLAASMFSRDDLFERFEAVLLSAARR